MRHSILATILIALAAGASSAHAAKIELTFENKDASGGFYFTPVVFGFHNGSYDLFNAGSPASAALEMLAEDGITGGVTAEINSAHAGAKSSVLANGGPFAPGSSNALTIELDPTANRYLSIASMVVPSNDAFIGNDAPTVWELFDAVGNFNPTVIDFFGSSVWDAGTEENDTMGAAFSMVGGTATDTADGIAPHPGLINFVGTKNGFGEDVTVAYGSSDLIARISARQVPDNSSYVLLMAGLSMFGFYAGVHRRNKLAA